MTITLGVIGTGAIGREHIRRCSQVLQGAKVTAVADVNAISAQACIDEFQLDAKVYPSGEALLNESQVDAVLITCWDKSHEEFVLQALALEKYIFCEKPLAVTAAGCKRIVDAEMRLGRRCIQVGFMRRYDRGYQALKAVIDSGEIGQPLMLHGAHRNVKSGDHYSTDMAITNTLIHEIDVHRWLLDDNYRSVQVVFSKPTSYAQQGLRDPQLVLFETSKGRRLDVEVFVNCQYGYDIQCHVIGEKGTAKLPDPLAIAVQQQAQLSTAILTDWQQRFIEAYDIELQAFINDVKNARLTGPTAWDGLMAAVTADACILAQENGEIVPIHSPDCPDFYR